MPDRAESVGRQVLHAIANRAEAILLQVAAHYADLHPLPAEGLDGLILPGMENTVVYGGDGCPEVAEFARSSSAPPWASPPAPPPG